MITITKLCAKNTCHVPHSNSFWALIFAFCTEMLNCGEKRGMERFEERLITCVYIRSSLSVHNFSQEQRFAKKSVKDLSALDMASNVTTSL